MKRFLVIFGVLYLLASIGFSQQSRKKIVIKPKPSDIKLRTEYGSKNVDLASVLYFEDLALNKLIFSGEELVNRDFQINIKKLVKGKLVKSEIVFDSKTEGDYFKIRSNKFIFRVLSKITEKGTAKFQFQFNGFTVQKKYKVGKNETEFAQKDFLGANSEIAIPLNKKTYILTYMMPYLKKDGSKQYCEVVQTGVSPEKLGRKYSIPTYFLIDIIFI